MGSGRPAFERFDEHINVCSPRILDYVKFPSLASLIRDIKNKFKVIKRMGYRFRNDEYVFLKTQAACPVMHDELLLSRHSPLVKSASLPETFMVT